MRFTVVIPALNEAAHIASAVASAGTEPVIVVDAGSTDATAAIAREAGALVLSESGGRGAQQNSGATNAGTEALLFLHADSLLPVGWQDAAGQLLSRPDVALGAFSLSIGNARPLEKMIEAVANVRSRALSLPYGDQALFLTQDMFSRLGGFRPIPVMEDFDLVVRARRLGRVQTLPQSVTTSNRRWRQVGALKTLLINQAMLAGWALDVPPDRLANFYRKVR